MSCLVTDADVLVVERQRQERIVRAQRARAPRSIEDCADAPRSIGCERSAYPSGDTRRRVLVADAWVAAGDVEIESADPLGVWSCGAPRPPHRWPAWWTVADWAVWSGLCLVAIAYVAMR